MAANMDANAHPTIRAMSGAKEVSQLDPKATALVVIDFQNEYFSGGKMPIPDGLAAEKNAKRLLQFADKEKMPVFQVQHVTPAGSAVFAIDGKTVNFHAGMEPRSGDKLLKKDTVDVFASTDLEKQLKAGRIKTIIITGLMTHACVEAAARSAAAMGFNVIVASDASATRAITRVDGETVDAKALHRASLATIEDTFGDVMTTSKIIALPVR
nr:isochorismatase family protein [Glaciimonas soli]